MWVSWGTRASSARERPREEGKGHGGVQAAPGKALWACNNGQSAAITGVSPWEGAGVLLWSTEASLGTRLASPLAFSLPWFPGVTSVSPQPSLAPHAAVCPLRTWAGKQGSQVCPPACCPDLLLRSPAREAPLHAHTLCSHLLLLAWWMEGLDLGRGDPETVHTHTWAPAMCPPSTPHPEGGTCLIPFSCPRKQPLPLMESGPEAV